MRMWPPMMPSMLGLCCCASTGMLTATMATSETSGPSRTFRTNVMVYLPVGRPKALRQTRIKRCRRNGPAPSVEKRQLLRHAFLDFDAERLRLVARGHEGAVVGRYDEIVLIRDGLKARGKPEMRALDQVRRDHHLGVPRLEFLESSLLCMHRGRDQRSGQSSQKVVQHRPTPALHIHLHGLSRFLLDASDSAENYAGGLRQKVRRAEEAADRDRAAHQATPSRRGRPASPLNPERYSEAAWRSIGKDTIGRIT